MLGAPRRSISLLAVVLAAALAACEGAPAGDETTLENEPAESSRPVYREASSGASPSEAPRNEFGWFTSPLDTLDSWVEVDVDEVNLDVERAWKVGLLWPTRAFDVALRAIGPVDAADVHFELQREGIEGPAATVVMVQLGLQDDSVQGVRDEIDLAFQLDGTWRVVTHWRSLFCPRGPGRGAWMAGPCH